jgi:RecA/RadA recombinase
VIAATATPGGINLGGVAVWGPVIGAAVVLGLLVVWLDHRKDKNKKHKGGQVIGVVGRMGSGKSYFAVKMAYNRLLAGVTVVTNFTMHFDHLPNGEALAKNWRQFSGWDQFAELENAVVIIDEAHLYAPSSKHIDFPMIARFKMSQARKFKLDVYWISQHEDRVNRTLRDLTSMIFVCESFFGGTTFKALGYEPEKVRRKDQHIERRGYRIDLNIANLYDTLQILDFDDHLHDAGMERARTIGNDYNRRRAESRTAAKRGPQARPARTESTR